MAKKQNQKQQQAPVVKADKKGKPGSGVTKVNTNKGKGGGKTGNTKPIETNKQQIKNLKSKLKQPDPAAQPAGQSTGAGDRPRKLSLRIGIRHALSRESRRQAVATQGCRRLLAGAVVAGAGQRHHRRRHRPHTRDTAPRGQAMGRQDRTRRIAGAARDERGRGRIQARGVSGG